MVEIEKFHFYKHFTSDLLEGITIAGSITFPNKDQFQKWIEGVNKNHARGKLPYYVTKSKVQ